MSLLRLFTATKHILVFVSLTHALTLSAESLGEEQIVVADDGREVLLKTDGSWHYIVRDRYATTSDGQQILLMPDGNWRAVNSIPAIDSAKKNLLSSSNSRPALKVVRQEPLQVLLDKVEILRKKSKGHKSNKLESRTLFYLLVRNRGDNEVALSNEELNSKLQGIQARSSTGEKFKILRVDVQKTNLKPGETSLLSIVTDGSPKWFNIQYLSIELAPDILKNSSRLQFRKDMDEVSVKAVKKLK